MSRSMCITIHHNEKFISLICQLLPLQNCLYYRVCKRNTSYKTCVLFLNSDSSRVIWVVQLEIGHCQREFDRKVRFDGAFPWCGHYFWHFSIFSLPPIINLPYAFVKLVKNSCTIFVWLDLSRFLTCRLENFSISLPYFSNMSSF